MLTPQQQALWDKMVQEAKDKNKSKLRGLTLLKNDTLNSNTTDNRIIITKPSQWVNFGWFFVMIPFCWLVIPVLMWIWNILVLSCWQFQFNDRTIAERKGVFSVLTREIHYFRIKSIRLEEPFLFRLVGLSNVTLITSDPFIPILKLYAVYDGHGLRKYIKDKTIFWRQEMGVKETDFHDF